MPESWPRRRLLAMLREADEPLDAGELARRTGQHVTTVRFHLDILTKHSQVRQVQQPPRGRGRPRIGYVAVQRSIGYQELAQVLADQLGSDPTKRLGAAVSAGRAWASKIPDGDRRVASIDDARTIAAALLSELGFAPDHANDNTDSDDGTRSIRLSACPLRDLARTHSEVVCGVHLGMLREVLDRAGSPGQVEVTIAPFVEPEVCVAKLAWEGQSRAWFSPNATTAQH